MKTYAFNYDVGERVMIVACTFTDNDGRLIPLKSKRGFIDAIKISAFGDHYLVRHHSKYGEVSEWMNDQQFQKDERQGMTNLTKEDFVKWQGMDNTDVK